MNWDAMLLLAAGPHVVWYLFPLAASVSLVYSATRFEYPPRILRRAGRLFVTIVVAMAIVLVLLYLLSFKL